MSEAQSIQETMNQQQFVNELLANKRGATHQAEGSGSQLPGNGVDPIVLAFFLLLDAATTSSNSAVIKSKQLKSNAIAQQRLDNEDARMHWYYIPKEKVKVVTYRFDVPNLPGMKAKYSTWDWKFWKGSFWDHGVHYGYQKQRITKVENQVEIDQAQARNQQAALQRQKLADKMRLLQQYAAVEEGGVNLQIDESINFIQEGSNLMQVLESLTFKALLRKPVQ